MRIIHAGDGPGSVGKTGSRFAGEAQSYLTLQSAEDGLTVNTVSFAPGARTFWHSHERGQLLQVIAGRGLTQVDGGDVQVIRAGDTVWVPAGERHWHGAGPDTFMAHVAISLGTTTWDDEAPDLGPAVPAAPGRAAP